MPEESSQPPQEPLPTTRESLETQMIEAINSGPAIEVTPEFWQELKARVHEKLAKTPQ
jgi:hypothetical protein